ncbi:MAG: glycerophosphodiester phosphodiesterase family protein [Bacteroidia bacterium]
MHKLIISSFILILISSCKKTEYIIENLNNNKIMVFGHGGMGVKSNYPIDTFESIINCLKTGADGSEMDVQVTKDSVLVAYHPKYLEDNTNINGMINTLTWEEVKKARFKSLPYLKYSIISLDELFQNINNPPRYHYTFDCKSYNAPTADGFTFYTQFSNALIKIIEKYNLQNSVFIESREKDFLAMLKSKRSDYMLFTYPLNFEEGLAIAQELNLYGITTSTADITKDQIALAHSKNIRVAIWNIDTKKKNRDAILKNPDFIQTDNLKYLMKLLE